MKDSITTAFRRFLSGEISISDLQSLLAEILASEPSAAPELARRLEELLAKDRLPLQLHDLLMQLVPVQLRPVRQPPPATATRLKGSGAPGPVVPQPPPAASPPAPEPDQYGETLDETGYLEKLLEPGALIHNRFLLEERIGTGGMGEVFRARDQHYEEADDRDPIVAIKFLGRDFRHHPESRKALQREVRKTHRLAHPNIVTVYNFDRDGPLIYMTMEFLRGSPLDKLLRKRGHNGMAFSKAWPIIKGAGAALAYAHKEGLVHSDFKPANVFVTDDQRIKVLDFGIARAAAVPKANDQMTRFDVSALGALTPAYASPEMLFGLEPDPRDDVYGLACVAYELLAGQHPFKRQPASRAQHEKMTVQRIKGLPRRKMRALREGLAFTRAERTASVERFLNGLQGRSPKGQLLRVAAITGAALVVAASAAGGYYWTQRCPGFDQEFIDSLRATAKSEAAALDDGQLQRLADNRDVLMGQGTMLLDLNADEFSPTYLSVGPSSAYGAFTRALLVDADDAAAIEGISMIIAMYEAQAEKLYAEGDYASSAEMAGYGLALHPKHCGLNKIARQTKDKAN